MNFERAVEIGITIFVVFLIAFIIAIAITKIGCNRKCKKIEKSCIDITFDLKCICIETEVTEYW